MIVESLRESIILLPWKMDGREDRPVPVISTVFIGKSPARPTSDECTNGCSSMKAHISQSSYFTKGPQPQCNKTSSIRPPHP